MHSCQTLQAFQTAVLTITAIEVFPFIAYSICMKYFSNEPDLQTRLLNRFVKYVKVWTESSSENADKGIQPSTERQLSFAKNLAEEIKEIGLKEVQVTEFGYVYAVLPASKGFENVPPFCLLSHMDTVEEVTGKDVKPIIHPSYDGAKIDLQCGVSLDIKEDECLAKAAQQNDTIITTDGTTLLGADDKAGLSEIVSSLEFLVSHKGIKHGPVEVIFSPDEETGHGMDRVPLNLIKSKFAYTVDGGHIGELESECFNAYGATVTFIGKSTHTGDARKKGMVNAICAASLFVQSLPPAERPETTDGYQGFFAVLGIQGSVEKASVNLILRDFSEEGMNARIEKLKHFAISSAESYGARVDVEFKAQYKNMKGELEKNPEVVQNLENAYKEADVEILHKPIRGGTDGSRLTELGIPTPNIFTGGHNFHSRYEWASLSQMCAACDVLISLAEIVAANRHKNKKK